MATNFVQGTYAGVDLSILSTSASNIQVLNFRSLNGSKKSLRNSSYFGINGGWYNRGATVRTDQVINIAMNNGSPVGPDTNRDGRLEGSDNYVGSGVVAWNGSQLSCYADVSTASEISFLSNRNTWAQGGIALWLGYGNWEDQVDNQPAASSYKAAAEGGRTALIANMNTNTVYLIITTEKVTMASFRSAIQSFLGIYDGAQANYTIQGIMLDGGSSTQMRAKNSSNSIVNLGNSSAIPQFVALKSYS